MSNKMPTSPVATLSSGDRDVVIRPLDDTLDHVGTGEASRASAAPAAPAQSPPYSLRQARDIDPMIMDMLTTQPLPCIEDPTQVEHDAARERDERDIDG